MRVRVSPGTFGSIYYVKEIKMKYGSHGYTGKGKRHGSKHNKSGNIVPPVFNKASLEPGHAKRLALVRRPEPPKEPITTPMEATIE